MNPYLPDTLINGFLLCLSCQLLFVGFWCFLKSKNVALGCICFIIGAGWLYNLYFPLFRDSPLANFILSGYKDLALFPLFYLFYIGRMEKGVPLRTFVKHLLLPLFVSCVYLIVKFGFKDFFAENFLYIINSIRALGFILLLGYTFLIVRLFHEQKPRLKIQASKRYLFVFGFFFMKHFLGHIEIVVLPFLNFDSQEYYTLSFRYFWHPLNIVSSCVLLLFALSEIRGIQKLIFGNTIHHQFDSIKDESKINQYIEEQLIAQRVFLQSEFDIKTSLSKHQLSERNFRLFIKRDFDRTINEFVNKLKVEEFLKISKDESFAKYSMDGLYEKAGFNSRATFYRILKREMGVTPSDYLQQRSNRSL